MDWLSSSQGEEDAATEDAVEVQDKVRQDLEESVQEKAEEMQAPPLQDWEIKPVKPHQERIKWGIPIAATVEIRTIGGMHAQI